MNPGVFLYAAGMFIGTMMGMAVYEYVEKLMGRRSRRKRDEQFLYFVQIHFQDATSIKFIAVETSDELAMQKIKKEILNDSRVRHNSEGQG